MPTKHISGSNMYGLVVIVIVVDGAVLRFDVRPPSVPCLHSNRVGSRAYDPVLSLFSFFLSFVLSF